MRGWLHAMIGSLTSFIRKPSAAKSHAHPEVEEVLKKQDAIIQYYIEEKGVDPKVFASLLRESWASPEDYTHD